MPARRMGRGDQPRVRLPEPAAARRAGGVGLGRRRTACSTSGSTTWRSSTWRAGARPPACPPGRGALGAGFDAAWNLAACVTVNRFLAHLKVGRPPEGLGGPTSYDHLAGATDGEDAFAERLRSLGNPPYLGGAGTAGPGGDLRWEGVPSTRTPGRGRRTGPTCSRPGWRSAVGAAVDIAGGVAESLAGEAGARRSGGRRSTGSSPPTRCSARSPPRSSWSRTPRCAACTASGSRRSARPPPSCTSTRCAASRMASAGSSSRTNCCTPGCGMTPAAAAAIPGCGTWPATT